MSSNAPLYTAVVGMCLLSGILGFTIGLQHNIEPRTLEPYKHCLQDNRCIKNVKFYIEYYEIKNRQID